MSPPSRYEVYSLGALIIGFLVITLLAAASPPKPPDLYGDCIREAYDHELADRLLLVQGCNRAWRVGKYGNEQWLERLEREGVKDRR